MLESALTIGNRALGQCGARAVMNTLDEDSNEARLVTRFFPRTVVEILTAARWNFASAQVTGAIAAGTNPPGWRFAYAYPPDALRIAGVYRTPEVGYSVPIFGNALSPNQATPGTKVPYSVGRLGDLRAVFCNISACVITYTRFEGNYDIWEPQALLALEYALAAKLAIPVSGDKQLAQMLKQEADAILVQARTADANEDISIQDVPVDWLLAREGLEGYAEDPSPSAAPSDSSI